MTFTIESFKAETLDRGLFASDYVEAHTAIVKFDNGDWVGVSRYVDEQYWIVDCAFRENGYPIFSNGTGSRLGHSRALADDHDATLALNSLLRGA